MLDSNGQPIADDGARLKHIRDCLGETLANNASYPDIVSRRTPRQVKSFSIPTETRMSVDEIKNTSVLEVASPDRVKEVDIRRVVLSLDVDGGVDPSLSAH